MHFLCEEFSQIVTSDVLYDLSKEHLLSAIQSDYLQVRKQDITHPSVVSLLDILVFQVSVIDTWLVHNNYLVNNAVNIHVLTHCLSQSHNIHTLGDKLQHPGSPELSNTIPWREMPSNPQPNQI